MRKRKRRREGSGKRTQENIVVTIIINSTPTISNWELRHKSAGLA